MYEGDEKPYYFGRINQRLEGEELFTYLVDLDSGEFKPCAAEMRIKIAHAILTDMVKIHEKGIYHLDLKPENIMIAEKDGSVSLRVIDFEACTSDLETNNSYGTMGYFPPEHFLSKDKYSSEKRDVYALACTLLFVMF